MVVGGGETWSTSGSFASWCLAERKGRGVGDAHYVRTTSLPLPTTNVDQIKVDHYLAFESSLEFGSSACSLSAFVRQWKGVEDSPYWTVTDLWNRVLRWGCNALWNAVWYVEDYSLHRLRFHPGNPCLVSSANVGATA